MRYLWAWLAAIRSILPVIVVHENVPAFPYSELLDVLGDLVFWVRVHVDPEVQGWASRRARVWDIFVLKCLVRTEIPQRMSSPANLLALESLLTLLFSRQCTYDWTGYLFDDPEEPEEQSCFLK